MAKPILPVVDDIVARGIHKLIALRPSAAPFLVSGQGTYANIFAGWKGQLTLLRRRLADEAASRRLPLAEKKALVELVTSEFFATVNPDAQKAIGQLILSRPDATAGQGTIKEGTRFKLSGNPDAIPAVNDAAYVTTAPVYMGPAALTARVPIEASLPGTAANIPISFNTTTPRIEPADPLFDPTITVLASDAAGGSSGVVDPDVRALGRAMYSGQYAPTPGALIAGALNDAGVKHVAVFKDTTLARSLLFIADESWAYSVPFQLRCTQVLKDNQWVGFGARMEARPILNYSIVIDATLILTDPKYGHDTSAIASAVREAARRYFNERRDFYTFNLNALGGVIATADPKRILTCSTVAVTDAADGTTVSPAAIAASSDFIFHYVLPDNGVNLTFASPS